MALSSSISSSEPRRGNLLPWMFALLAVIWVTYFLLGDQIAAQLGDRFGKKLLASSQGRIVDARHFLEGRLWDAAILATLGIGAILIGSLFYRWMAPRVVPLWHWLPLSIYTFVVCNLLLLAASHTNLFWCALYVAGPNLKQAAFHAERTLLRESKAPCRVVMIGSSQGQSEIAGGRLNGRYYPEIQFSNLSYAGAQAFDFLLLQEQYLDLRPDLVVCYLSELNFYTPFTGSRFLPFLTPGGLQDYFNLWKAETARTNDLIYGLQGMALPSFRMRRAIEFALFDSEAGEIKGARRVSKEDVPVVQLTREERLSLKAASQAGQYKLGNEVEAQKRSLEHFLERNSKAGIRTVVILGQVSPILQEKLPPEVHTDFVTYVRGLQKSGDSGVLVLDEPPQHVSSDYADGDFMHVTHDARDRFTDWLGETLAKICQKSGGEEI